MAAWDVLSVTGSGVTILRGGTGASSGRGSVLSSGGGCFCSTLRTDAGAVLGSFFSVVGTEMLNIVMSHLFLSL